MTQRLGKYEIIEEIGRGGFATVYRARDPDLDREVALKVLDPLLMRDPSLVGRFRREARAAARLRHPNIVRIYDITETEGVLAIVMELLPGPSLAEIVEAEAPMAVDRAIDLLCPLAEALDYAHGQGLIHRDVKPSNVILDEDGAPMLTDFGLVKAAEESGSLAVSLTLSQTGMALGTPAYMAPEQADPEAPAPADRRADLYSLGVIAYELLAGQVPFVGNTPLVVAMAHLTKAPPPPRELNPALPEGVEAALVRMLAKAPEDRFSSAGGFVAALAARVAEPEAAGVLAPEMAAALPEQPGRKPSLRLGLWIGGSLVVLALILGLALTLGGGGKDATPAPPATAVQVAAGEGPTSEPTGLPAPTGTPVPIPAAGDIRIRPADGMEMAYVPEGEFPMGSAGDDTEAADDEKPQHTVSLDAFWIDRTEVTNAMFARFVADTGFRTDAETRGWSWTVNPSSKVWESTPGADWQHPYGPSSDLEGLEDHPVVHVSWSDARAYCEWAGARLPMEAEWEKAARGSAANKYPWGDAFDGTRVNFCDRNCEFDWKDTNADDGFAWSSPVGSFPAGASPYGAQDMVGNVWEWVHDWHDGGYYGRSPASNPPGPDSGEARVLRGGSWFDGREYLRCADRYWHDPLDTNYHLGFRCAATALPQAGQP